jgi:hypothetical protein
MVFKATGAMDSDRPVAAKERIAHRVYLQREMSALELSFRSPLFPV